MIFTVWFQVVSGSFPPGQFEFVALDQKPLKPHQKPSKASKNKRNFKKKKKTCSPLPASGLTSLSFKRIAPKLSCKWYQVSSPSWPLDETHPSLESIWDWIWNKTEKNQKFSHVSLPRPVKIVVFMLFSVLTAKHEGPKFLGNQNPQTLRPWKSRWSPQSDPRVPKRLVKPWEF